MNKDSFFVRLCTIRTHTVIFCSVRRFIIRPPISGTCFSPGAENLNKFFTSEASIVVVEWREKNVPFHACSTT